MLKEKQGKIITAPYGRTTMLFQIGLRYKKFLIKIVGITEGDKIKDWIY